MLHKTFEDLFDWRVGKCRDTLVNKAREYAQEGDRLHNFKIAAALQGESVPEAVGGMMAKHVVSIFDMLHDLKHGIHHPRAVWDEKLGDAMNYMFLLDAALEEQGYDFPTDPVAQVLSQENVVKVYPQKGDVHYVMTPKTPY